MSAFSKLWKKIRKPLLGYATAGTIGAVLAAKEGKKRPGSVLDIHNVRRGVQYTLSLPGQVLYKATGGQGVAREVFMESGQAAKAAVERAEQAAQQAAEAANKALAAAQREAPGQPVVVAPTQASIAPVVLILAALWFLTKGR